MGLGNDQYTNSRMSIPVCLGWMMGHLQAQAHPRIPVTFTSFSPDGRRVASCLSDKTIHVRNMVILVLTHPNNAWVVSFVVYSTDGKNTLYQPTEPFTYGIQSVGSIIVQSNISWFRLIKKYIALSLCVIASISPPCAMVAQD